MEYYHSVTLDKERCIGCTNCLKRCPTEAIRIRDGRAVILNERCIDCGECVKACPCHAKVARTDAFDIIDAFKYKIALPAPALFPQFKDIHDPSMVIEGLYGLGFDFVFESAIGAGLIARAINEKLESGEYQKPLISSSCPAIVKLIQVNYPSLIENIVDLISPMEAAAKIAKDEFCAANKVSPEDVGVIYITPCGAKMTAIKSAPGIAKSHIDASVSIQDIFGRLVAKLSKPKEERGGRRAGALDIGWALDGGEMNAVGIENSISVDGIVNVINCLEEIDNLKFNDLHFFEGRACTGGCIGGPLTVESSYVARNRMRKIMSGAPDVKNGDLYEKYKGGLKLTEFLEPNKSFQFEGTIQERLAKMDSMNKLLGALPGLDCGSCGSPTCGTLAEDIVRGYATELNCIFKMKDEIKKLAEQMVALSSSTRFLNSER